MLKPGTLVRYKSNTSTKSKELGIILTVNSRFLMSDVLWLDYIVTCNWEDLEQVV